MGKIEKLTQGKWLKKKCDIDGIEPATHKITFTCQSNTFHVCRVHLDELKKMVKDHKEEKISSWIH